MSLVTLPATASIEEILPILKRDGAIILSDFVTDEDTRDFLEELAPHNQREYENPSVADVNKYAAEMGEGFLASNTVRVYGLLGKCPKTITKILQNPVGKGIFKGVLDDVTHARVGNQHLVTSTTYLLSGAIGYRILPGAEAQILHRDQTIHSVKAEANSLFTSMMGIMVAGTESTAKNGATNVIPGSHLWGPERAPQPEEAVPAIMKKGSALFWFGSSYHGGGANTEDVASPTAIRQGIACFICREYYRQEENQTLAVPASVAHTLPEDVLAISGWRKASGGAGFVESLDPIDA
ncbi:hypothetical protein T439DRAFT_286692 [Meredithblackwellia eburnea MCA 4105]